MKKISTAALLLQKSQTELSDLLQEAYARIAELEKRNQQLTKQLQKLKTTSAKQRQRAKSLGGQLKAEKAKVQQIRGALKTQRAATKAERIRASKAEAEVKQLKSIIKQIKPRMSKEEVFEMYRTSNLTRFWQRITSVHDFDPEKIVEMNNKMSSWSSQKLRDAIRVAGLRSTWYDSDAQWNSSEVSGWDERNLYAFIMSF